eukprot:scaffold12644_cov43-Cyclotella_meneghiniana.AAC.6
MARSRSARSTPNLKWPGLGQDLSFSFLEFKWDDVPVKSAGYIKERRESGHGGGGEQTEGVVMVVA